MKLIAALAVSGMLLMGQSDQPASHLVTAVRHWSLGDVTRVAIEVSGSFEFRTDRLHNPERVYFDILDAQPRIDSKRAYAETVNDRMVQRIRVAETLPGTTRVVLDLIGNVVATTSTLTNPDRLIIELRTAAGGIPTDAPPTVPADHPPMRTPPAVFTPTDPSNHPLVRTPPAVSTPTVPADHPLVRTPPAVSTPTVPADRPLVRTPPANSSPTAKPVTVAVKAPGATDAAHPDVPVPGITPQPAKPEEAAADNAAAHAAGAMPPEEIAKAAKHTSSGTSSLIRALGLKINRVVIDPGHGGHDQGTEGPKGLLEKDLVLDVALRVGKLVQDRMGAEVIYTRTDDTFIPLEGRTALANEKKADLFLSIHANSSSFPRISGVETYYLNINGSKDAMDVAGRENGPTQSSIFELQDIIKQIAQHDKSEESREFATRVEASLYAFSTRNFPGSRDRGVKTAPFVVLIGANMPSVLAEIGFVSNSKEEALLKKPDYRQKLAEALYKGMEKYTESLSHFQAAAKP
jgi:N-acetylmuramoyl-L-alanine amidase